MCYSITSSPQSGAERCQPNQCGADVRPVVNGLYCGIEEYWWESLENHILTLAPGGICWVTLGKLLLLSEPQFPHLLMAIHQNLDPEQG